MALKIGILTLPITYSYGGILQTIALSKYLKNNGHNVTLIYKSKDEPKWRTLIKKFILYFPYSNIKNIKTTHRLTKFYRPFIEEEITQISKNLYTKEDLEKFVEKENFDVIIVGSDQVWRKTYINDKYYKSYFLDFVDSNKTKKIAYAASFGKDYWEGKDDIEDISKLMQDFIAISTREQSGVNICLNSFGYKNSKFVLDPTMLMNKEFYLDEIISKYEPFNSYKEGLLTFILDETDDKNFAVNFVSNKLEIKKINHLEGFKKNNMLFSVAEWLSSIQNATFVVTDSFHGMVFSIIFEKDFLVIGNINRGIDRFTSLLQLLNLENRLILDSSEITHDKLSKIDFNEVKEKLEFERTSSILFLNNALNKSL